MSGRLTVWIDGREALPVRAIPFVAGGDGLYSPDEIAANLARTVGVPFAKLRGLVAYQYQGAKPLAIDSFDWARCVAAMKGFETALHEQRPDIDVTDDHVGYAEWFVGAVLKLPAGVFIWLDQFVREREADREQTHGDNVPIRLSPLLVEGITRTELLEGFEECPRYGENIESAMVCSQDFKAFCRIDDFSNFGGYCLKANGLHKVRPNDDNPLTSDDDPDLTMLTKNQYESPELLLPCSLEELRRFMVASELADYLDEDCVCAVLRGRTETESTVEIKSESNKPKHGWGDQAWEIGNEWMLAEEKRTGKRPSIDKIAMYVEGVFSTRNIVGPRGRFLDRETIKREALTGITGRKKGYNFQTTKGNPQRK